MIDTEQNNQRSQTLSDVRKRLGLTQAGMAPRLGIKPETVSAYERKERPVSETVWKLIQHERVALGDFR